MFRFSFFIAAAAVSLAPFQSLFSQKMAEKRLEKPPFHRIESLFDAPAIVAMGLVGGGSQIAAHGLRAFAPSELDDLVATVGPSRFSFAERSQSLGAKWLSDGLAAGSGLAAAHFCWVAADSRRERATNFFMLGETVGLTFFLTETAKNAARQPRPFVFNPAVGAAEKLKTDARRSFFSGHTSMTAATTFFMAKVWSDRNPGSPQKPLIWAGAVALPATVGFLRMAAGRHYFRDVTVGFAVGGLVGWAVPEAHGWLERRHRKKEAAKRIVPAF